MVGMVRNSGKKENEKNSRKTSDNKEKQELYEIFSLSYHKKYYNKYVKLNFEY